MDNKRLIFFLFLCTASFSIKAQQSDYQIIDSISAVKYLNGDWKDLVSFGNKVIANGNDFLALRLRLGYAQFQLKNYSSALIHYQKVLKDDSREQTALSFGFLSNVYLNRDAEAGYLLSQQDRGTITPKPFSAIEAGFELGLKYPAINTRGNSTYTRISFANRLGYRLTLSQSISYFNQQVFSSSIKQYEYYGKLNYMAIPHLGIKAAYHYLNTSNFTEVYHNGLVFFGLNYQLPYFSPQLDFSFGKVNNIKTNQYNLTFTYNPLGNLGLYGISKISQKQVDSDKEIIFSQILGVKANKSLWFEALATMGEQNHFAEADNLYIYNGIDPTKFKAGSSVYYLINSNFKLNLNYTYERKTESNFHQSYKQNSLTTGLTWKF